MKHIMIVLVTIIGLTVLLAEWPSGGPYQLRWGALTNGGTEGVMRESVSGLLLSDNLGNCSYVADSFLTDGTLYRIRPGYRKVDWDERYPYSSINPLGSDTISSGPTLPISWGGADTTTEDGIGWGIRYYDIQFKRNTTGTWRNWYINTPMTSGIFGPFSPDTVWADTTYFFRCRAHDKVGNVEPWPTTHQAWARYEMQTLQWIVVNYDGENDWTLGAPITLNSTTTADSASIFIVKNLGATTIDIGVKGYDAIGWDLKNTPGFDRYTLKARFDDNRTPPVVFAMNDVVYDSGFTWATASLYGPGGWGIQGVSADSVYRTENLWLQLLTPTAVSVWLDNQVIRLDLKAKPYAP